MHNIIDDFFIPLLLGLVVVAFATLVLACLIYAPAKLVAEERCLAEGYPEARVTWNFNRYCMNLDGTVTVEVTELE